MSQLLSFAERRRQQDQIPSPSTFLRGVKMARQIGNFASGGTGAVGAAPFAAAETGAGIGGGGAVGGLSGAPGAAGWGGGIGGSGAGEAAQSVVGQAGGTSTLGYLGGPAVGFGLGRATQSRGVGAAGGFLTGLAMSGGNPFVAIAGAIAGIIGGAQKDSPPPPYKDYVAGRQGITYGVSPGGPVRPEQMYPNTKESYVADLNKSPWPGQTPEGSIDIYNEPTVSAFGGTRSATDMSRPGGFSTTPYAAGQSPAYRMAQFAVPAKADYNAWRDAYIKAMG